ncbi:DASH complex subunit Dad3 [Stutzerimonas nitrititolerans]
MLRIIADVTFNFGEDNGTFRAKFNVTWVMRSALQIDTYAIKTAELFAPGRKGADAVMWLLDDYPRLVAELRELRRRVDQLDREEADFDARLEALQNACRAILDL